MSDEPKRVEASFTMVGDGFMAQRHSALAQALEDAMVKATMDAHAEGIIDPDEIRERKMAAYESTMAEHQAALEAALAAMAPQSQAPAAEETSTNAEHQPDD